MWFMDQIVTWLNSVTQYFLNAYYVVSGWVWPVYQLATPLYWLYYAFFYITYYFGQFNTWLDWAVSRINVILSTSDISSYFRYWFDAAQNAWSWVSNAVYNVWATVDSWWSSKSQTVLTWIADAKSWSLAQVNSLRDTVWGWISDVKSWTTAQVNTAQATILGIITNVQTWTTTQVNNVRTAILATISDLSAWTTAQVNTIQAILTTLVNWTAFTQWITTWWNNRLLDLGGLINSAFLARESLWAGWQDMRSKVIEFFSDPLEFLWERFSDWFFGGE